MGKNLNKIFAILLTFCMVAVLCTVPMTASAEAPQDETYEAYVLVSFI